MYKNIKLTVLFLKQSWYNTVHKLIEWMQDLVVSDTKAAIFICTL